MAKVTAPELSMNAAGQFAGLLIYTSRNGVPYVKFHATPHVTATKTQSGLRAVFSFLTKAWQTLSPDDQAYWASLVPDPHLTPANLYVAAGQTSARLHNTWPAAPPDPDALPPPAPAALATSPLARAIRITWLQPETPNARTNQPRQLQWSLATQSRPNDPVFPDCLGYYYEGDPHAGQPTRHRLAGGYAAWSPGFPLWRINSAPGAPEPGWEAMGFGPNLLYIPSWQVRGTVLLAATDPPDLADPPDYCIEIHRSLLPFDEAHPPTIHTLRAALPYTAEQILDTGLTSGQTYHYALRYQNRTGIHGDIQTITEEPT